MKKADENYPCQKIKQKVTSLVIEEELEIWHFICLKNLILS